MTASADPAAFIARAREAVAKATPPGDWASGGDEVYAGRKATYHLVCRMTDDAPLADDNADLIALAVNALPALLDVAEAVGDVLSDHDERVVFYGQRETQPNRVRVMEALRAALSRLAAAGEEGR